MPHTNSGKNGIYFPPLGSIHNPNISNSQEDGVTSTSVFPSIIKTIEWRLIWILPDLPKHKLDKVKLRVLTPPKHKLDSKVHGMETSQLPNGLPNHPLRSDIESNGDFPNLPKAQIAQSNGDI